METAAIAPTRDPDLVEQARRGDLEAFESIVRDRMGAVYRTSLAIVGNEADAADATQDAFVAAWKQIGATTRSCCSPAPRQARESNGLPSRLVA